MTDWPDHDRVDRAWPAEVAERMAAILPEAATEPERVCRTPPTGPAAAGGGGPGGHGPGGHGPGGHSPGGQGRARGQDAPADPPDLHHRRPGSAGTTAVGVVPHLIRLGWRFAPGNGASVGWCTPVDLPHRRRWCAG